MQKRSFTLIEVLISFVLASLLIGALFSSLKTSILIDFKASQIEKDVMKRAAIQHRLDSLVFAAIRPHSSKNLAEQDAPFCLTNENVLCFTVDNGIDPDPNFCGPIQTYFKLEGDLGFMVILEGADGRDSRSEVLIEDVKKVSYRFLYQDDSGSFLESEEWNEERGSFPSAVKLCIALASKKKYDFVSWLSRYPKPILYSKSS